MWQLGFSTSGSGCGCGCFKVICTICIVESDDVEGVVTAAGETQGPQVTMPYASIMKEMDH